MFQLVIIESLELDSRSIEKNRERLLFETFEKAYEYLLKIPNVTEVTFYQRNGTRCINAIRKFNKTFFEYLICEVK